MAYFFDDFNRPNENLVASANWTREVGFGSDTDAIVKNEDLSIFNTSSEGVAFYAPDTGSNDNYVIVNPSFGSYELETGSFICVRLIDHNNFIGFRWGVNGSNYKLEGYQRVSGVLTQYLDISIPSTDLGLYFGPDSKFQLGVEGNTIHVRLINPFDNPSHPSLNTSFSTTVPDTSLSLLSTQVGFVSRLISADPWIKSFGSDQFSLNDITGTSTFSGTETGSLDGYGYISSSNLDFDIRFSATGKTVNTINGIAQLTFSMGANGNAIINGSGTSSTSYNITGSISTIEIIQGSSTLTFSENASGLALILSSGNIIFGFDISSLGMEYTTNFPYRLSEGIRNTFAYSQNGTITILDEEY